MTFERKMPSVRLAITHHGDDLQAIAAREMGDANRWYELVWINGLKHPYITSDPRVVGDGVLLAGDFIRVPAPRGVQAVASEQAQVFERDCAMSGRMLQAEDGDLLVVAGAKNLKQQLEHRITTPRGQMRRHHEYGCMAPKLKGSANTAVANALAAQYVKSALLADYRVSSVPSVSSALSGDSVRVTARAEPVIGGAVDVVLDV